jgi:hypothetical protein
MFDLIGDIHGHAQELIGLLDRLGTRRSLRRPCIACIDLRSLSLKSPSTYRLAASRCGWREEQH